MKSTIFKESSDNNNQNQNPVFVIKYADYSSKYGLGYKLSNGSFGAFFNDSTKIILPQNQNKFCYIDKKNEHFFLLEQYPKENKDLDKRVKLLMNFINYFEDEKKGENNGVKKDESNCYIYVKIWIKTKSATTFILNNNTKQIIFKDKTEIRKKKGEKWIYYVNKEGKIIKYNLEPALNFNTQVIKRWKYFMEILNHIDRKTKKKVKKASK